MTAVTAFHQIIKTGLPGMADMHKRRKLIYSRNAHSAFLTVFAQAFFKKLVGVRGQSLRGFDFRCQSPRGFDF